MRNLKINIEQISEKQSSYTISFDGDFDGSAKENLTQVQSLIDSTSENTNLILDFTKLHYMNSYGIGQLVNWHNILNEKGGKIIIACANKNIKDIFAILGINELFETYPDMTSAMEGI